MTGRELMGSRCAIVSAAALLACLVATGARADRLGELAARASCLIEANSIIKLSVPSPGILAKVNFKRGDRVKAGAVVAELESAVEEATYRAARLRADSQVIVGAKEAERVNAGRKLNRTRQLATRDYASQQALEDAQTAEALATFAVGQAKLDLELAEAEAERLKAVLERRFARSPVDGVVTKIDLHPGEHAEPTTSVALIAEIKPLRVEVYLPLAAFPLVKEGMRAEIRPQEPIGGAYAAKVVMRDPLIDSASGLFQVLLELPNEDEAVPSGVRCQIAFSPSE